MRIIPYFGVRMKHSIVLLFALLVLAAVSPVRLAQSQKPKPSIKGIVTDPMNQRIPGVTITVTLVEPEPKSDAKPQAITVRTDDTGTYAVDALPAGTYKITALFMGFTTRSFTVEVKAESTVEQNVTLKLDPDHPLGLILIVEEPKQK
jgi:hypothetical protein